MSFALEAPQEALATSATGRDFYTKYLLFKLSTFSISCQDMFILSFTAAQKRSINKKEVTQCHNNIFLFNVNLHNEFIFSTT